MLKKSDDTIQNSLYYLGWAVLACLAGAAVFVRVSKIRIGRLIPPCMIHEFFGIYCPGCGGTRAVRYLIDGQILKSLYCHPLVGYCTFLGGWFMISNTAERLTKGKLRIGMKVRPVYGIIAVGLIAANCLLHNVLKFGFHIVL